MKLFSGQVDWVTTKLVILRLRLVVIEHGFRDSEIADRGGGSSRELFPTRVSH